MTQLNGSSDVMFFKLYFNTQVCQIVMVQWQRVSYSECLHQPSCPLKHASFLSSQHLVSIFASMPKYLPTPPGSKKTGQKQGRRTSKGAVSCWSSEAVCVFSRDALLSTNVVGRKTNFIDVVVYNHSYLKSPIESKYLRKFKTPMTFTLYWLVHTNDYNATGILSTNLLEHNSKLGTYCPNLWLSFVRPTKENSPSPSRVIRCKMYISVVKMLKISPSTWMVSSCKELPFCWQTHTKLSSWISSCTPKRWGNHKKSHLSNEISIKHSIQRCFTSICEGIQMIQTTLPCFCTSSWYHDIPISRTCSSQNLPDEISQSCFSIPGKSHFGGPHLK